MHKKLFTLLAFVLSPGSSFAHGFGGSGLLHPLTGIDHILTMVAVGAWSAQLGGRAIYIVPSCFLSMMFLGAVAGINNVTMTNIESMIALSAIFLGLAISIDKKISLPLAGLAVGVFASCHGFSHGSEMPHASNAWEYIIGFLITTLGLHVIGAAGGLLILEKEHGRKHLRFLGGITSVVGTYLLLR